MYADIHSHPAAFAYDRTRLWESPANGQKHPWAIPPSLPEKLEKPGGQAGYSQADLAKCIRSNTRLLFASLSPIEKGFFSGVPGTKITKTFLAELHERWHNDGEASTREWLLKQLKQRPGFEKLRLRDLQFLSKRTMNLSATQVKKLQSPRYDYFEELKNEYGFFLERSGKSSVTTFDIQIDTTGIPRKWEGAYTLAANSEEINIDPDTNEIFIVPTLGGVHSLGVGNPEDTDIRPGQQRMDADLSTVRQRIRQLKGEEPLDNGPLSRWQHRPFYITFAQHFFNTFCGHARCFNKSASLLYDQRRGQDQGILNGCMDVWRELLALTPELDPTGSSRILIDVHHMSAAARLAYYKNIIHPHNRRHKNNPIPVIATQAAYGNNDYLQNFIDQSSLGHEESERYSNGYLAWSINLTDEDVLHIFHSKGLLGLTIDQQLLGGAPGWLDHINFAPLARKRALNLVKRNLQQFVRIPFEYHISEPHEIWQRLAIGSGFDGFVQPLSRYPSVLQFHTLEADLIMILDELKHEEPLWFGSYRPDELARMICFENAFQFVKQHYK
jgi:hypothetical protein